MSKSGLFFYCGICTLIVIGAYSYFGYKSPPYPFNTKIHTHGFIRDEPDVRIDGVRYIVRTKEFGDVYVSYSLYPRFSYGDVVEMSCVLKKPEPIEEFHYEKYLARYGVYAICSRPYINALNQKEGNTAMRTILSFKEMVATRINELWHEPYASFMAGLLYGYRGGLGSLDELFKRSGVTHIVAISGYNITMISTILIKFFSYLLIPRKTAFWLIIIGIICFLIFAGLSASVVRAGIMGIIVLIAQQLGRPSRIANVLLLTALCMAIENPYVLLYDAGFQLSFISTIGLIYFSPLLEPYTKYIPDKFALRESFTSTMSAIIATLPLILFQFNRLSIVAPIVNVLILWLIPWIMGIGFFAVVFSYIFLPLGIAISWIAYMGMEYIVRIVSFFAAFPFATVDIKIPLVYMCILYVGLVYLVKRHNKKQA